MIRDDDDDYHWLYWHDEPPLVFRMFWAQVAIAFMCYAFTRLGLSFCLDGSLCTVPCEQCGAGL